MVLKIVQGTTPTLSFVLPLDPVSITAIEMTISSRDSDVKIRRTDASYDEHKAMFMLTQAETMALAPDTYNVQLRIEVADNKIYSTLFIPIEVARLASKVLI